MRRRIILAIILLLCLAPCAWPKFKDDEKQYLDDQFKAMLNQMQAMSMQVAALNARMEELKQTQVQLQAVILREQHQLQDLDDMLSSLRLGDEENFSQLKVVIADLRAQAEKAAKLAAQAAAPPPLPEEVAPEPHPVVAAPAPRPEKIAAASRPVEVAPSPRSAPSARSAPQGYITAIEGANVMIDLGSAQGVKPGVRLAIYKAADPDKRVGVIEVTQVVDASNSRARIVTMNSGMKPEFSDVVHVE
jgi:hypothetical protein